jgi:cytochrome c-type biogenesis protein CcmH
MMRDAMDDVTLERQKERVGRGNSHAQNTSIDERFRVFLLEKARQMASLMFLSMVIALGLTLASPLVVAQLQTPELPPPSAELALRLKKLESELRCLVCQNQTLAESPAGLAGDLRREVRSLVESGKSDAEIKTFLKVRYGDFVLYKPPVESKTWLLWYGPFALLFVAAMVAWRIVARRKSAPAIAQDAPKARARKLLDDEDSQ